MKTTSQTRTSFLLLLAVIPAIASGWQLSPEGSFIEKKLASRSQSFIERMLSSLTLRGISVIGDSVHEEITNRTLGCDGDADICGAPEYDPDFAYYLAGVRWNDDPPFRFSSGQGNFTGCVTTQTVRLVTQPVCWGNTFKDGESRAAKGVVLNGTNATLLVRSHFGDMQFLHAMASSRWRNARRHASANPRLERIRLADQLRGIRSGNDRGQCAPSRLPRIVQDQP